MENEHLIFALAGNPNCGKTTLFNSLTGSTAYVGNWPGVTVEKREGIYKKKEIGEAKIIDLPGIYSLSPYTPEEVISRNFILEEKPDCVINVLDATNLERNLYMTTQILEMDVPVVIALNMMDAVKATGVEIDCAKISEKLGVPVVPISALRFDNLDGLMKEAIAASKNKREGRSFWNYGNRKEAIDKAVEIYKAAEISNPLFHAIKALEGDEIEQEKNAEAYNQVKELNIPVDEFEAESADQRYKFITSQVAIYRTGAPVQEKNKLSKSDKVDKVLTNKWAALPILVVIFFLIFHLVFSEDLFYLGAMGVNFGDGYLGAWKMPDGEAGVMDGLFWTDAGINSLGVIFANFVNGITGWFTELVRSWITGANAAAWVDGFICDGVLAGLFAVIGFLPQILLLFFFFSILEDSGYMARVAFVLDRIFRKFGVSGRAFLPMLMGFGCGVPAMINTRTLASDKERIKTIRVIPFFTCSAKLPILVAIAGGLAAAGGIDASLLTFFMYVLGFAVAIISVIVMNKTTQREEIPPFIMELPSYHLPQPRALAIHIWDKAKHFFKKAFTIILATTILVWLFTNITWDWVFIPNYAEDAFESAEEQLAAIQSLGYTSYSALQSNSILACLGKIMQPIFTPCGFGSQTGANGWTYSVAAINGLIAKENVIGTLGSLGAILTNSSEYAEEGVEAIEAILANTTWTQGGLVAFIVFNLLTIPCFASVATAKAEMPDKKSFVGTVVFWLVVSYVTSCLFYVMIDWTWTIAIIIPALILIGVGLYFYDKKMKAKEAQAA